MFDIHVHILPCLDDGPKNWEQSLAMAGLAAAEGLEAIVATPHTANGVYTNTRETILEKTAEFNQRLRTAGINLKVLPGADVRAQPTLLEELKAGRLTTLADGGRYLLLELSNQALPSFSRQLIFDILLAGVTPIISHPERNLAIQKEPALFYEFIQAGALGQVTALSLTGGFGPATAACARKLLSHKLIHFLASDAHNTQRRPPRLSAGRDEAARLIGDEAARALVEDNPRAVLSGKTLEVPEPEPFRRFFSF